MKYEFFYQGSRNDWNYQYGSSKFEEGSEIVQEGLLYANKITKHKKRWHNGYYVYYVKTYSGLFNLADGDCPRIYLYIGKKAGNMLKQISALTKIYEKEDLLKVLRSYQYIVHTIPDYFYVYGNNSKNQNIRKDFLNFENSHKELARFNEEEFILERESGSRSINTISIGKELSILIKHAQGLLRELASFKIDLSKLRKKQKSESFMSSLGIPPVIQKAIMIGGIIGLKAAARSIGSDMDYDFDIDFQDDTNADGFELITTDDLGSGYDVENGSFEDLPDSSNGGYNVAFGRQKATLSSVGGILLDATIEKEPGSSSLFCIKTDNGIVHNVKKGDDWVKIDNIRYRLPELKG
jgi:hypothetical protein